MYSHSALILLTNYELQLEVECNQSGCEDKLQISRNQNEVQESTGAITELLRELVKLDLVKYLPTSAVTCTVQPFLLNLLDHTLANDESTMGYGKLGVVLEAMRVYQSLYDNTDLVLSAAHRISLEARLMAPDSGVMSWGDILARSPKAYLRLILAMDAALAKGSFPQDADLPFDRQPCIGRPKSSPPVLDAEVRMHAPERGQQPDGPSSTCSPSSVEKTESLTEPFSVSNAGGVSDETSLFQDWGPKLLLLEPDVVLQSLLESYLA
ncbi:fungal specific transcription factor domain-containing protein [Penicillium chermesinum]|nr:fungal specific transcription factor domain-containing protein [Penicillium chermesinum]